MQSAKRRVEVFTAGCAVCEPTVELVKSMACPSWEVVVYDLREGCATNECREKAKTYGITALPAVAVNGRLLDCCSPRAITAETLRAAGIGEP